MWDVVGNPEDRFSHNVAHIDLANSKGKINGITPLVKQYSINCKALFFLILGLQIFFKILRSEREKNKNKNY